MSLTFTKAFVLLLLTPIGQVTTTTTGDEARLDRKEGPVVFVAERTIDIGDIREGTVATATFLVENRGNEDLLIQDIKPSCGCTTVELTDEEHRIKPEHSQKITVKYDTSGRSGRQLSRVTLVLNDPVEPLVHLLLNSNVQSLFRIEPRPLVNLRSNRRGEQLPSLDLLPTDKDKSLEVLSIDAPAGIIRYETEPISEENGDGVRLKLWVSDESELGIVHGTMTVRGRVGDEEATLPIAITGKVVGELTAVPISLQSLGLTPRGLHFAPITVSSTIDKPFDILSADAGPYIDITVEPRRDNREFAVRATLKQNAPNGPLATMLVIHTDNRSQPLIEIPLFVNVKPRYVLEPTLVELGDKPADQSRRVRIQRGEPGKLRIRSITADSPQIIAKSEDTNLEVGDVRFIRVRLAGDPPAEPFETTVKLVTNMEDHPQLDIPVHYRPD